MFLRRKVDFFLLCHIYRYDSESRGGGVLIAVANSIASRQIHHHFDIEIVTVELTQANITVSCLYVPPNSSDEYCGQVLSSLRSLASKPRSIISGDFNLPDLLLPAPLFSLCLCVTLFSC